MRKVVLYHLMSLDGVAYEDGDWLADDGPQLVAYLDRVIDQAPRRPGHALRAHAPRQRSAGRLVRRRPNLSGRK
ncbi:hypothetical protein [Microbispora bryophytorum]|uniref:Bacterial bifunctional deaminase-reductase C-terminal domain-containing protein n=1 Tax=Microbispora bryophytorum subsp. camponoti TaxID=1677852 RepID=A0ABR8LCP6_9ACTN|nr:hypothetical protein [Microbispora camponoti]MBD3147270.1 hypothetical protein [Microbispora camponoti]